MIRGSVPELQILFSIDFRQEVYSRYSFQFDITETLYVMIICPLYFAIITQLPTLKPLTHTEAEHMFEEKPRISTAPALLFSTSNVIFEKSEKLGSEVSVGPTFFALPPSNVIFLTLFGTLTVTLHFALTPLPSAAVAVISAVPFAIAVTVPFAFTVATLEFELLHVILLFAAFPGLTVAVRLAVWPFEVSVKDD